MANFFGRIGRRARSPVLPMQDPTPGYSRSVGEDGEPMEGVPPEGFCQNVDRWGMGGIGVSETDTSPGLGDSCTREWIFVYGPFRVVLSPVEAHLTVCDFLVSMGFLAYEADAQPGPAGQSESSVGSPGRY